MSRTYPYKAWAIPPSGKPVEVVLVENYDAAPDWDVAEIGGLYHPDKLHPTKNAAIEAGLAAVDVQQTTLDKKRATLIAAREQP